MLKEERQQKILDILYKEGQVNVSSLANQFETSKDTIRRDLTDLEEQGVLKRAYGGAIPKKRIPFGIDARKKVETDEKYEIAKKAKQLIKPESLVAIDGGSTNILLASMLPLSIKLRVVTNSFPVADELRKRPNIDVFFLGGTYNKESQTTVGDAVYQQLKGFRFDQCFLGAYAIDSSIGITVPAPYEDEANVKRFLIENSAEVNIMGALSKLDKVSNYVICDIGSVDRIICEGPVSKHVQEKYQYKII
jgi:DeoR/GlpR family transcriptional regulator of sugar metabolism